MFDFRLKVFYTAATRLNFSKAAEELSITQPAVTKHIHEIESFYRCKLFERNGTKISLTAAGNSLLNYAENIFAIYRDIEFEFASINEVAKGSIKLGASTTVAQYVLPKYLALFKEKFPHMRIKLNSGNTEKIEHLLSENKIDCGIVEGKSRRPKVKYIPFLKDEIVLCTKAHNHAAKPLIQANELRHLPLVNREHGSGSLEVVSASLRKINIKFSDLRVEIILESSESIKGYLLNSNAFAFLSRHAIAKELERNDLMVIDIKNLAIERYFYIINKEGDASQRNNLFLKFLRRYNQKL